MKSGNLNFLEPSGPLQACNGTALPLYIYIYIYICIRSYHLLACHVMSCHDMSCHVLCWKYAGVSKALAATTFRNVHTLLLHSTYSIYLMAPFPCCTRYRTTSGDLMVNYCMWLVRCYIHTHSVIHLSVYPTIRPDNRITEPCHHAHTIYLMDVFFHTENL